MKDNHKQIQSILTEIFGDEYQIAGQADAADIQRVATYVDKKMREVVGKSGRMSKTSLAVLAAMEITAELFQAEQERDHLVQKAYASIDRLSELIDQRSTLLPFTSEWIEQQARKEPI